MRSSWLIPFVTATQLAACNPGAFDRLTTPAAEMAGAGGAARDGGSSSEPPATQPERVETGGAPRPDSGGAGAAAAGGGARAPQSGGRMAPPEPEPAAPLTCAPACEAPRASGRCVDGTCRYTCSEGRADCDLDLERGARGNGCEVEVASSLEHCGRCDLACSAPSAGYASCDSGKCTGHALAYTAPAANPPHGTAGVNHVRQLCPDRSVVTGFDGYVASAEIVDSLRVRCSPLTLVPGQSGPEVRVGASGSSFEYAGGSYAGDLPTRTPFSMQCAAGEVVADISWAIWSHWSRDDMVYPTIKDLEPHCARPQLVEGKVELGSTGSVLTSGATRDAPGVHVEDDACSGGLIRGFDFDHGSNLDQVLTLCSVTSVSLTTP